MSIGELAKKTDVKVVTIRYYEQIGLLPEPPRTAGNYRVYTKEHVQRLSFLRRCRDLGFSLGQVRDLLQLSFDKTRSCVDVCRIAESHLKAVEDRIADLRSLASQLRRINNSCAGNLPMAQCRIIEALSLG